MRCHPNLAIFKNLLFPNRDGFFQRVNAVAAGVEGGCPVRGAHGDDDGGIANLQCACAMVEDDSLDGKKLDGLLCNFLHLGNGHGFVGFKFKAQHWLSLGCVAHRADEHVNATGSVVADEPDASGGVKRGIGEYYFNHFYKLLSTAHGRNQCYLIVFLEQ